MRERHMIIDPTQRSYDAEKQIEKLQAKVKELEANCSSYCEEIVKRVIIDKELMPSVCEDSGQAEWSDGEAQKLAEAIVERVLGEGIKRKWIFRKGCMSTHIEKRYGFYVGSDEFGGHGEHYGHPRYQFGLYLCIRHNTWFIGLSHVKCDKPTRGE